MTPPPNRSNKTPKQILLAIADELQGCTTAAEVETLLNEAKMLIWMEFDDVDNNPLKKELEIQISAISKYNWQKSQNKKNSLLKNVVADSRDSITYYYSVTKPKEK